MSTNKARRCPTCGAKTVTYKHSLSAVLMAGFQKVLANCDEMGRFNIASCGLTYSERENLRKLQYWGIIVKQGDDEGRGGDWRVTVAGLAFAEGMSRLHYSVRTYRGKRVEYLGREVSIEDVTGGWKYRPDYVRESRPFLDEPEQRGLL